jgi:hypothetical protein
MGQDGHPPQYSMETSAMTARFETRLVAWARRQGLSAAQTEALIRRQHYAARARARYQEQKDTPAPLGYVECRCGQVHAAYTRPFTATCCGWMTYRLVDGETLRAAGITLPKAKAPGRPLEARRAGRKTKRVKKHAWEGSLNTSQRRRQILG